VMMLEYRSQEAAAKPTLHGRRRESRNPTLDSHHKPSPTEELPRCSPFIASMATTTAVNVNATGKRQASPPAPIQPLRNETARLYTHLHPALILSLYALKFPALVADPVPALLSTLLPLAVLQIAYVAVCLPPTGGTPTLRKQKPGEKKGKVPGPLEQGLNSKIVVSS